MLRKPRWAWWGSQGPCVFITAGDPGRRSRFATGVWRCFGSRVGFGDWCALGSGEGVGDGSFGFERTKRLPDPESRE